MPYRKRTFRGKRKPTYRRRRAVYRKRRFMRARPELKVSEGAVTGVLTDGGMTSTTLHLSGTTQGLDNNNRIGRKVTFVKEMLRLNLSLVDNGGASPEALAEGSAVARVMIVQDKQPNGAAFATTDLLVTQSSTSFNNLNNGKRFYVHMDRKVSIDASSGQATVTISRNLMRRITTTYQGTTNAIGDVATNALWLLIFIDNIVPPDLTTTVSVAFDFVYRARFIDA